MGHPAGWADPNNHGQAAKSNLTYCQQCHSDNPFGGPGSNPRFNVQLGRLVDAALGNTGCEVCHAPLAAHPRIIQIPVSFGTITTLNPIGTPWYLHCKASPSGFDACNRCHGANLDGVGGVTGATGCTFCHRSGLPTTLKNCTSCHVSPPNGAVYPNKASAHAKHSTLNVADICGQCHNGLGSVTLDHFSRAKNHTTSVQAGAVLFGAFAQTNGVSPVLQRDDPAVHQYLLSRRNALRRREQVAHLERRELSDGGRLRHLPRLPAAQCRPCRFHVEHGLQKLPHACQCHQHWLRRSHEARERRNRRHGRSVPHAFPNPGSVHATAAGTAPFSGCVTSAVAIRTASPTGVYPVAAGTPPDCRACHIKLAPGNSCGSCHGIASTNALTAGRPNGSSFPDVAGRHA